MKIFISWSGDRSKKLAEALRKWLPNVIQALDPWMSSEDIPKGKRWRTNIGQRLEGTHVGIICLTKENLAAPWILFEAGALAKVVKESFICTYLLDLTPTELADPLAMFQATVADKDDTLKLLNTINNALGDKAISEQHVNNAFEKWWPDLQKDIDNIPEAGKIDSENGIPSIVKAAVHALDSPNLDDRVAAIETFVATNHLAALDALVQASKHPVVDVRMNAISKLGKVLENLRNADIDVITNALDLLNHDDKRVRATAVRYLAKSNARDVRIVLPSLLKALHDEEKNVRATACRVLGKIGGSNVVAELMEVLYDKEVQVRVSAISALKEIGGSSLAVELVKVLCDKEVEVRVSAISALEEIGDSYAVPYITRLLSDNAEDFCGRKACDKAAEALEKIGTPEALKAVKEWKENRKRTE